MEEHYLFTLPVSWGCETVTVLPQACVSSLKAIAAALVTFQFYSAESTERVLSLLSIILVKVVGLSHPCSVFSHIKKQPEREKKGGRKMLERFTNRMKRMSERGRKRAIKVRQTFRGLRSSRGGGGGLKLWSQSLAERPADPWTVVRDWRGRGGSRSIPLSTECESPTVIPSTPDTHTHLYT